MDRILALLLLLACGLATPVHAADAPAERTIVLVRHGNYLPDPQADERLGPHLSPLGSAQARLAAARLAGMPGQFDHLYASPVQRARDTAAIIGESFPGRGFEVVDDLAECTPHTWRTDVTKGEKPADMAACAAQLDRVFKRFFHPASGQAETDLLVCHGNVIRYLVTRALGVDTDAWLGMSIGHASITRILVKADGSISVISVGDVGHIPPNMLSGTSADPRERDLSIPVLP
ncbi:MAG: histidine phosphatase family protein [Thermomonas sp.]